MMIGKLSSHGFESFAHLKSAIFIASFLTPNSNRSRRRRDNTRRRQERAWEQRQRKEPGRYAVPWTELSVGEY